MVGVVAGGGRTDKPILKAGVAHFKYRTKRRGKWFIFFYLIIFLFYFIFIIF